MPLRNATASKEPTVIDKYKFGSLVGLTGVINLDDWEVKIEKEIEVMDKEEEQVGMHICSLVN